MSMVNSISISNFWPYLHLQMSVAIWCWAFSSHSPTKKELFTCCASILGLFIGTKALIWVDINARIYSKFYFLIHMIITFIIQLRFTFSHMCTRSHTCTLKSTHTHRLISTHSRVTLHSTVANVIGEGIPAVIGGAAAVFPDSNLSYYNIYFLGGFDSMMHGTMVKARLPTDLCTLHSDRTVCLENVGCAACEDRYNVTWCYTNEDPYRFE